MWWFSVRPRLPLALGGLAVTLALGSLACGDGGAPAASPAPLPAPQQPTQPAPSAPAAEPQPAAPAPRPPARAPAPAPAATAPTPKYGGTLTFFMRRDLRGGFDPHNPPGGRRETRVALGLAYEALAGWDTQPGDPCSSRLVPWLAEGWKWTDPTTLEVSLRKGVRFHNRPPVNGRELAAEDVIFSYQRLFKHGLHPGTAENLASLEAPDRHTLRFKFKQPLPLVAHDMLSHYQALVMAPEAGGPKSDYSKLESAIGTGPFVLKTSVPGVEVTAERNPTYWLKGLPYLDKVRLPIIRDVATRVAALEVGKLDVLDELSTSLKQRVLQTSPKIQWVDCETSVNYTLIFNTQEPPFTDARVRRAVSMAVDREGIVKGVFRGEGRAVAVFSPGIEGAVKITDLPPGLRRNVEYNPTAAKGLLAEAGYPKGFPLELFGGSHQGSPYMEIKEATVPMLKAVGIDAKLGLVESAEFQTRISAWRYGKAAFTKGNPGSRPPIEGELANFHSRENPSNNRSQVKEPELDQLIERLTSTLDAKERADLVKQIQIRMVDQVYFVALPLFIDPLAYQPWVKGERRDNFFMWISQSGWRFRELWIDK